MIETKIRKKAPNSYFSEEFKRKVIEDYLQSGLPKKHILLKYGIRFQGALRLWMSLLGYNDPYKKVRYIEVANQQELAKKFSSIKLNKEFPDKRIAELERQLADEQLRNEAYRRIIEKAEKELRISIRKKSNTK